MFLVGILSWWYGSGWLARLNIIRNRLKSSADFFSVGLLISTLFSPFRQISANDADGVSISDKTRALFDRLLSRIIGSIVRSFMILIGVVVMLFQSILGAIILVVWLVIPVLPIIGLIMTVIGWVPVWMN